MQAFAQLIGTISDLLGPHGSPWDRKQTVHSMRPHLLEECYELLEAIAFDDHEGMCEELGDLFWITVFLGKLAEKEKRFCFEEAIVGAVAKLIRRHPHVFGDAKVERDKELQCQWDRIRKTEKQKRLHEHILDDGSPELAALVRTQKLQKKISWSGLVVRSDVQTDPELQLGKELWVIVEKARKIGLDAERALRRVAAHKEHEIRTCELERTFEKRTAHQAPCRTGQSAPSQNRP